MKKINLIGLILALTIVVSGPIRAQVKGQGEVTKNKIQLEEFTGIEAGGAQEIVLLNGDSYSAVIETNENLQQYISYEVVNKKLRFKFNKIKRYDEMKFYVTAPVFEFIGISGAAELEKPETLKGDKLKISSSGAAEGKLKLDYNSVVANSSGASELKLSGNITSLVANTSGASEVKAYDLNTKTAAVKASGASECSVNATENLTYSTSGSASVKYSEKPKTLIIQDKKRSEQVVVVTEGKNINNYNGYSDTTKVNVGSLKVEVIENDTTKVNVGNHTLIVSDDGDVRWEKNKCKTFNGHWGGVEIGINGYVTPDFNTNWAPEYDYLNLRYEKSVALNLNIYEQNIALNKNKNFGMITGLGLSWNNYRFTNATHLTPDSNAIQGYYMDGISVRKSKLTAMYLTIPVIFEIQSNNPRRSRRVHFAAGVIAGLRLSTHSKVYFNEADKVYTLIDPKTGNTLPTTYRSPNSNSRNIVKNFDSFYLRPFKFDATVRMGYGIVNLFATYSINTLFQNNRGPELYAWTAGITIAGW